MTRKQTKARITQKKQIFNIEKKGFKISDCCTKVIAAYNTSTLTCQQGDVWQQIAKIYLQPKSIIIDPTWPFSILVFESIDDSKAALSFTNGEDACNSSNELASFVSHNNVTFYYVSTEDNIVKEVNTGSARPNGLLLIEDFITEQEELNLCEFIEKDILTPEVSNRRLKNRLTLHYGYEFDYESNGVDTVNPISYPPTISQMAAKIAFHLNSTGITKIDFVFDQCTVNVYEPGDGIGAHVDSHQFFNEFIISLSLLVISP